MVMESVINPLKAEKRPWEMFFIGFVYSSISILLALWIFRSQTSLLMVFLTVMASLPIIYNTMRFEEGKDLEIKSERRLLLEHNKAVVFLLFLFFGITLSFVAWYVMLPTSTVDLVFEKQTATIQAINNAVSGSAFQQFSTFIQILVNNIKVLAFSLLFAFIYGAGAIFILTWNASVIGAAMGNFIRSGLADAAGSVGLAKFSAYFGVVSLGILRYSIHGIPEILAYVYGGVAGGIISVAVIKKHYKSDDFSRILFDVSELLLIAVSFLLVAAFIEVYVTPTLF